MSTPLQNQGVKDDTYSTNKQMSEESNPIKEYLFEYLESKKIQELALQSKLPELINDVLENCFDKIILMGEKEESVATFATGLLHYLLTNALIPSQRKIEHKGVEIDIVVPNLKTLENDPDKALIIHIPKTMNVNEIKQKLDSLKKIQPNNKNIWLVLSKKIYFQNNTYIIEKNNPSFLKIIVNIGQFANVQGQNKFKILRI